MQVTFSNFKTSVLSILVSGVSSVSETLISTFSVAAVLEFRYPWFPAASGMRCEAQTGGKSRVSFSRERDLFQSRALTSMTAWFLLAATPRLSEDVRSSAKTDTVLMTRFLYWHGRVKTGCYRKVFQFFFSFCVSLCCLFLCDLLSS